jgi:peptide/nickel transport system substrate-binding protein
LKKVSLLLVILLVCSFLVIGCGSDASTTKPAATTTTAAATTAKTTTAVATTAATTKPSVTTTQPTIAPSVTTTASNTKKNYGGSIRWIESSGPSSAIGAVWESPFANASQQICFDTILRETADGSLLPWLCSYEVNADPANPSYTLHLVKGIKYQDGTDFNATSLKWSIQKLIDSKLFASVTYFKSLEVKDDYTLYLPLTEWRNSNLPAMAKTQHWTVSPTAFEKNGLDWIRDHMVGTGPFIQTDYQRDVSLSAKRNENYWIKGTPYLDSIQYLYVSDQLTQQALFKSGGAEVYNTNGNAMVASQLAGLGYNVISQTAGAQVLLPDSANKDSPWSNLKVRQAVEYAIDKESIAKTFGYGYWQAATQAPSPEAPGYVSSITGRKYDVAKAKSLLTEAGYPNGFKTKIIAQDNADKNVLVALQSAFAKVGITAELQIVQAAAMTGIQSSGWNNGVLFLALGFEGNIIPTMGFNFPPVRTGRYKNVANTPRWEELYRKVATTPTLDAKVEQEVTQDVYDFLMWIPIYWYPSLWATTSSVQDSGIGDYAPGSLTFWSTNEAWLKK